MDRKSLLLIDIHIDFCYIIGMDIKSFQQRCGLTQTDIADKLSVTQATVSSWAMNRTTPTLAQLKQLIFMGMTIGEIFDAETEAFVMKNKAIPSKKIFADVVRTGLVSLVNGKGPVTDKNACMQIVKTGLEELFAQKDK